MATIRKRGTKWQVQVRRVGHRSISASFNVLKDARAWAREREIEADRGMRLLLMPNASGASRVVRPYRVQKLHEFIGAGGHRKSCEGNEGACHGYF
jgi:hypothetical protein